MNGWFKNLIFHRLTGPVTITEALLAKQAFTPCTPNQASSIGWISPRDNDQLAHVVQGHILLALAIETRTVPGDTMNRAMKERIEAVTEQQGYKPGKTQRREIKEVLTDELLPRAFPKRSIVRIWIDQSNRLMAFDTASNARSDDVFRTLLKTVPELPITNLRTMLTPQACMTAWLDRDEAPAGFTVDQDAELMATGQNKAVVRYVKHTLDVDEVRRHIQGGKRCTRLALTWNDRVSFVLTDGMTIKRIAPLDVLKENNNSSTLDADERFDNDFFLMTAEFAQLAGDLVAALGGEEPQQAAA